MKFSVNCFLFLFVCQVLFGADTTADNQQTEENVSPETANASAAADEKQTWEKGRVHVRGTNVSMVPPDGFVAAGNHNGFVMPGKNVSIIIIEIPQSYAECKGHFTEERLVEKGDVLDESQEIMINGHEAMEFKLTVKVGSVVYRKYLFAYGNDMLTSMVYAVYPAKSEDSLGVLLKSSILTARYYGLSKEEAEQSMPFYIQECDGFDIGVAISNAIVCTIEGNLFQGAQRPVFTVLKSLPHAAVSYDQRKNFALDTLRQLEYIQDIFVLSNSAVSIDGLNGYKIMAKGNHGDHGSQPLSVYFVILYDDNCYYMMIGEVSPSLRGKYFPSFKRMSQSFRRKKNNTSK